MAETQNTMNRREVLKKVYEFLGVSMCATCLGSLASSCEYIEELPIPTRSPDQLRKHEVDINQIPVLQTVGGGYSASYGNITGGRRILMIRAKESGIDAIIVFSAICPHGGYTLEIPQKSGDRFYCLEHNSEYNYFTGEMEKPPDTELDFRANLIIFKSEFDEIRQVLTIFY